MGHGGALGRPLAWEVGDLYFSLGSSTNLFYTASGNCFLFPDLGSPSTNRGVGLLGLLRLYWGQQPENPAVYCISQKKWWFDLQEIAKCGPGKHYMELWKVCSQFSQVQTLGSSTLRIERMVEMQWVVKRLCIQPAHGYGALVLDSSCIPSPAPQVLPPLCAAPEMGCWWLSVAFSSAAGWGRRGRRVCSESRISQDAFGGRNKTLTQAG